MQYKGRIMSAVCMVVLVCSLSFAGGKKEEGKAQPASTGKYGGTLRVATSAATPTLDPMATTHIAPREIGMHIFEGIVSFDENHKVVPMLAESWKISSDGLKYTFTMRKGVLFHNGKEMKAEDVKASIERFIQIAPRKKDFSTIKSVSVLDDYTVEVVLSEPTGSFLTSLGNPACMLAVMPKSVIEGMPVNKVDIIGTGPYKFVEWIPDRHVKIERFKDYKQPSQPASGFAGRKEAYLDDMLFIPVPEASSRVAGVQTGDYDFADAIPGNSVARLKGNSDLVVDDLMPYTMVMLYMNFTRQFGNHKLRQAIQAGLNMEEIMIASSEGSGDLDPGLYFKYQAWNTKIGKEYYDQRDPEKAKRLIKESGYKGEEIILVTNTSYDYMYKAAIVVEQQLKALGLNIKVVVSDWAGALAVRKDMNKWDLFFSSHSTRFDPVQNSFYFIKDTSFFGYNNPEMEKWLKIGATESDFAARKKAYDEVQRIFYQDAAMIKLYDLGIWQVWNKKVKNYTPWVMINFNNVYLEK